MKKIYLFLIIGLFLISLISAASLPEMDSVKLGECINISQTCATCSFVNISSISNKNNDTLVSNVEMISFGNGEWRYVFCDTTNLGRYDVKGMGDINGVNEGFAYKFEVTPSGNYGTQNMIFIIFMIVIIWGVTLVGFFNKNSIITLIGGMAMIFLGVYLINNGIIIYRDNLTIYFSYITSFLGGALAIMSAISLSEDLL